MPRPAFSNSAAPQSASSRRTLIVSAGCERWSRSVPTMLGQIRQGKMRPLAVTSAKRVDDLPNVPSINESG